MPCEAVAGKPVFYFGSPNQHSLGPQLYDKYVNITTVPNPAGGAAIAPYERFTQSPGGAGCGTYHCDPDTAPCSAWLLPLIANDFDKDGNVDFSVARKRGFKNVMAFRFWAGVFGYQNKQKTGSPDTVECCEDNSQRKWLSYQSAADGVKYLSISITAKDKITDYIEDGTATPVRDNEATLTQTIDANSGLTTDTLSVSPNDDRNTALTYAAMAIESLGALVGRMTSAKTATPPYGTYECTGSTINIHDSNGNLVETVTWNLAAGISARQIYQYEADSDEPSGYLQLLIEEEDYAVSGTSFSYSDVVTGWADDGEGNLYKNVVNETSVAATLSGENTSASVYADIVYLLAQWPLNDDALYPFRTDSLVSAAPLVSRDELGTQAFTLGFWVKDYSNPIADDGGATIGDPAWTGHCAIILAPDPTTGSTVVSTGGPASNGDSFAGIAIGNPFSHCLVTAYSEVGGTLPPGVSYDATTGQLSGTCSADCTWGITVTVTGAVPAATGNVVGAPKPAGYQKYFDFNYHDWAGCCYNDGEGTQTWSWYQVGWGGDVGLFNTATGAQLPLNATQWTNYFQSVNKPQGAFLFYNDPGQAYYGSGCISSSAPSGSLDSTALWGCKYAEILDQWNSENFALPAGDAKFWFDETRVYCAVNASGSGAGSTWTLTDATTGSAPPDGTDFSGTWGGPSVGGFYNVASYASGTLTLGSKVWNVPSNWASRSNGDDALCFGKLRWPSSPSLLGRIGVTPDMAGTTFTFASAQPAFGMDAVIATAGQEQIDIYDSSMTLLASNITATRSGSSDAPTQFMTVAAYPTASFVLITGVKYYWNDTAPKGDYALLEWLSDFRSYGEYQRLTGILDCSSTQVAQPSTNVGGGPIDVSTQFASFTQTPACVPFAPCGPKVVYISPNGEVFPNGKTYAFPTTFACDEQYGSKWWAYVETTMTDLFWQAPHRPCNFDDPTTLWKMDDGTCAADAPDATPPVYYYAHSPTVEARLTVPCNYGAAQDECAPALPSGIQIGWSSPVTNIYGTADIALPPTPPGAASGTGQPNGASTAWSFHALLCAHSTGCRFGYSVPGC
jgi:hypothetical protein